MSFPPSELVEISKLNGDFKRNYGRLIGAYLYLRSINATRSRSFVWTSLALAIGSAIAGWLQKHNLN
jgi:ABC-type spermidine/putrescine transport system permease subunit I